MHDDITRASAIAAALPDATYVIDANGILTWANAACEEVLGWPAAELLGRSVLDFVHPDDISLATASMDSMQARVVGAPVEVRGRKPTGEWHSYEIIARNCLDDPLIGGLVCTNRDLSKRRMWEVAGGDEERIQWVVQHVPAVLLLLDADGVITSANGALTRLLGWDPSDIAGRRLASFATDDHDQALLAKAISAARPEAPGTTEVVMACADDRPGVPMRFEIVDLQSDPVVAAIAVTGHDITDLYEARARLQHLADHDGLTDLANRSMLGRRLEELLGARRPLALLYVDLDRFKPVNDQHGHAAGDEVLKRVARRLVETVATSDVVARVGGDEFVVLAVGMNDLAAAAELAERLRVRLEEPFELPVGAVSIGASIGVALAEQGTTADDLMHEADVAMYASKGPRRALKLL